MNSTSALVSVCDPEVEALAKKLCDARWGEGTWDAGKIQRSYWRRQAKRQLGR
jgi:hypothetical protein